MEQMFVTCKGDASTIQDISGVTGVTPINLMQFLGAVEQHVDELSQNVLTAYTQASQVDSSSARCERQMNLQRPKLL